MRLRVELELPAGYKINPLAPLEYTVDAAGGVPGAPARGSRVGDGPVSPDALGKTVRIDKPAAEFDIALPVKAGTTGTVVAGRETIRVAVEYYYCREGAEGVCKIGSAAWIVPLELSATTGAEVVRLRQRAR